MPTATTVIYNKHPVITAHIDQRDGDGGGVSGSGGHVPSNIAMRLADYR
jgi:hypothetical protein